MKERNNLSFAIVTHNNEDIIANTISSIVEAVGDQYSFKIFIIDNESSDETVKVIKNMNIKGLEIIKSRNSGFGFGHNQVLNRLDSVYHFIVNPDISIPNRIILNRMIKFMDENSKIGLLSPLILNTDGTIQYLFRNQPTVFDAAIRFLGNSVFSRRQDKFVNKSTGYNKILPIENASGAFMMVRTDIFKLVDGFDERYFMYYEDSDLTRKINEISTAMFVPTVNVIHSWERASSRNMKYSLIMVTSLCKYMNKWGWKLW